MEIFLLLLDELDDAVASARMLLPRILGFLLACGAFGLSVLVALQWPNLALLVLFSAIALALLPLMHSLSLPRLKTDP